MSTDPFPTTTVKKPCLINQAGIGYVDHVTNQADFVEATVTYNITDQFGQPIPDEYMLGMPVTEDVSVFPCRADMGSTSVQSGGVFHDKQIWSGTASVLCSANQTIHADCATISYHIAVVYDPEQERKWGLSYGQTGGNSCP